MLTGESVPVEAGAGVETFAGALVRRGEAVAEVVATGARTKFGRTAELVRTAHVVSTQQKAVLRVVRNLAVFNGAVIVLLVGYAYASRDAARRVIPLVLTAVLASIPVALPATFTLAAALGARALARQGVLPTRLSAVDEAAIDGCFVRRQDRHADPQRADGNDRASDARLRRGACSGARGAGELRRRPGPRRCRDPRGSRGQSGGGRIATDQVRRLRSGKKDVRGDGDRFGGSATHREGRLRRRHRSRATVAGRGGGGEELETQGFRVLAVAAGVHRHRCSSSD